MTSKQESVQERRLPGWLWVWAAFVVFFALEAVRLS